MELLKYFVKFVYEHMVNTQNEQEEKVLLAFLESLRYSYQTNIENEQQLNEAFLTQYNKDIETADAEIEAGDYVNHNEVEQLFKRRRKAI